MGYNTDTSISNYWNRRGLVDPAAASLFDERLDNFTNPTPQDPVRVAQFLAHADLGFLESVLESKYRDPDRVELPPLAMLNAVVFRKLTRISSWEKTVNHLRTHPEDAVRLGFRHADGRVRLPSGEWLRKWSRDRVDLETWETVLDELVERLRRALERHGIPLGLDVSQDATPVKARGDPDAEYNDHYQIRGYKLDLVMDRVLGVPLGKELIGVNEPEGACLRPGLERLKRLGFHVESIAIDHGYTGFENLAYLARRGIRVHCRPNKSWVVRSDATIAELRRWYGKHWSDDAYRSNATLDRVVAFLVDKGHTELVGAWYRNDLMAELEEAPTEALEVYHQRNYSESVNGHFKNDLDLVWGWKGCGPESFDLHATQCVVSLLIVALTRARNGITSDLTSLRGFT